jgi:hypothetical protein
MESQKLHSDLRLRRRNLNIGIDVRVAAFLVTRIHSRRSVAVGRPIRYHRVGVQRSRIQHGINLGERSARRGVHRAINVIAQYVRGRARCPRETHRVYRRRSTSASQCFGCGNRLSVAGEGKRSARRGRYLRAEGHGKGSALTRRDGYRQ